MKKELFGFKNMANFGQYDFNLLAKFRFKTQSRLFSSVHYLTQICEIFQNEVEDEKHEFAFRPSISDYMYDNIIL